MEPGEDCRPQWWLSKKVRDRLEQAGPDVPSPYLYLWAQTGDRQPKGTELMCPHPYPLNKGERDSIGL